MKSPMIKILGCLIVCASMAAAMTAQQAARQAATSQTITANHAIQTAAIQVLPADKQLASSVPAPIPCGRPPYSPCASATVTITLTQMASTAANASTSRTLSIAKNNTNAGGTIRT